MAQLLGIDLGSSSVKVALVDAARGTCIATAQSPTDREMLINGPQPGWAEQDPESWWAELARALDLLRQRHALDEVKAVGISYQMHGLVLLDRQGQPLRPSIIWCDSRAVAIGDEVAQQLGHERLAATTLNSPGNFTASKWAWVAMHEPQVLAKAATAMLPGDYLAWRLTGERYTTASGLSEMVLWSFAKRELAQDVLRELQLDEQLLPPRVSSFELQGQVSREVCERFGFRQNPLLTYRAGDQPNNAYALRALQPGDVAATAGTSGVVYAVTDQQRYDVQQRVNTFLHVNDSATAERLGILLCVNGTGSAYAWLRRLLAAAGRHELDYAALNALVDAAPVDGETPRFYPFGNGAERLLGNRTLGARLEGLHFNSHGASALAAAVQLGIAAALAYGTGIIAGLGSQPKVIRAGRVNLFLSESFCEAFCELTGVPLELYDTDGAQGAARAAGVGAGIFSSHEEALQQLYRTAVFDPGGERAAAYADFYGRWLADLHT